ncbi:hypothetical protein ABT174_17680 [Streptomyces sparsogenes]|uniref:hypothetical protein n=1 Tax=Streptomyces sparsogenes TaxID=67365 RepID=UPI00332BD278
MRQLPPHNPGHTEGSRPHGLGGLLYVSSDLLAAITRLRELARNGEYAYYIDLAHFMGSLGLPAQPRSQAQWINGEQTIASNGTAWSGPDVTTWAPHHDSRAQENGPSPEAGTGMLSNATDGKATQRLSA